MRSPGMVDKDALVRAKAIQSLLEGLPIMLQKNALLLQPIIMNVKARYLLEHSRPHVLLCQDDAAPDALDVLCRVS